MRDLGFSLYLSHTTRSTCMINVIKLLLFTEASSSCRCYDQNGCDCIATCASNVYNVNVAQSAVATVQSQAMCDEGTNDLGCGIYDASGNDTLAMVQNALTAGCACFDNDVHTCYASCGTLQCC
jgi:hypothetical protein